MLGRQLMNRVQGGEAMKSLNQLIDEYTRQLQYGEMQAAYKAILEFIGKLRADLIKRHPQIHIGNIYQGYLDMTYFSLTTEPFKKNGLKIALVYLHEKGAFEVWLSARNREIAKKYGVLLDGNLSGGIMIFHDDANQDAIIECTLAVAPNFEDPDSLVEKIDQGVQKFITVVASRLQ